MSSSHKSNRVFEFFEWFFHKTYFVYIIVTVVSLFFSFTDKTMREIVLTVAVGTMFAILLIYQLLLTAKLSRKSRYAEIQAPMHQCMHNLRDTYHYLNNCIDGTESYHETIFTGKLKTSLTALNQALCTATGVNCRVSIKLLGATDEIVIKGKTDNLYLKTLARDDVSTSQKQSDDLKEEHKHLLNENSDFQAIYQGRLTYFSNGELWKDSSYRNSSDEKMQNGTNKRKDYNSTIVWPIRFKLDNHEHDQNTGNGQVLMGFLTADALVDNAFENRFDVEIGFQVADILYVILHTYRKVRAKQS